MKKFGKDCSKSLKKSIIFPSFITSNMSSAIQFKKEVIIRGSQIKCDPSILIQNRKVIHNLSQWQRDLY